MKLAKVERSRPGVVLDYITMVSSATNYVFQCDQTYYISGLVNLSGTTIFEGNTVLKFPLSATASIVTSNALFKSAAYVPVVFTSKDDNTVGESFGSGSPSWYYGNIALDLSSASSGRVLTNSRFCYLSNAIKGANITLQDAQLVQCKNGFAAGSSQAAVFNGLIYKANTLFNSSGSGDSSTVENVTAHYCTNFVSNTSGTINVTNSLFVCVTNWQCATTRTNASVFLDSDSGIFQTVGGAVHYLADNSLYRNVGTTNIAAGLLGALRKKTTYPPIVYSNITISVDAAPLQLTFPKTDQRLPGNARIDPAAPHHTNGVVKK